MLGAQELSDLLREKYAIGMKLSWVTDCLAFLNVQHQTEINSWTSDQLAQTVFGQFLLCDLNVAGDGVLPPGIMAMRDGLLPGKYVLQVDEIVNMSAPVKERYTCDSGSRMLKLHMTDGIQRAMGIEYRPIGGLSWQSEAGMKVMVHDVPIKKGVMLLQPHHMVILGGQATHLEAARQRAVSCWNRPARGRRPHEPQRDIFREARAAAWETIAPPQGLAQDAETQAAATEAAAGGSSALRQHDEPQQRHVPQQRQPVMPLAPITAASAEGVGPRESGSTRPEGTGGMIGVRPPCFPPHPAPHGVPIQPPQRPPLAVTSLQGRQQLLMQQPSVPLLQHAPSPRLDPSSGLSSHSWHAVTEPLSATHWQQQQEAPTHFRPSPSARSLATPSANSYSSITPLPPGSNRCLAHSMQNKNQPRQLSTEPRSAMSVAAPPSSFPSASPMYQQACWQQPRPLPPASGPPTGSAPPGVGSASTQLTPAAPGGVLALQTVWAAPTTLSPSASGRQTPSIAPPHEQRRFPPGSSSLRAPLPTPVPWNGGDVSQGQTSQRETSQGSRQRGRIDAPCDDAPQWETGQLGSRQQRGALMPLSNIQPAQPRAREESTPLGLIVPPRQRQGLDGFHPLHHHGAAGPGDVNRRDDPLPFVSEAALPRSNGARDLGATSRPGICPATSRPFDAPSAPTPSEVRSMAPYRPDRTGSFGRLPIGAPATAMAFGIDLSADDDDGDNGLGVGAGAAGVNHGPPLKRPRAGRVGAAQIVVIDDGDDEDGDALPPSSSRLDETKGGGGHVLVNDDDDGLECPGGGQGGGDSAPDSHQLETSLGSADRCREGLPLITQSGSQQPRRAEGDRRLGGAKEEVSDDSWLLENPPPASASSSWWMDDDDDGGGGDKGSRREEELLDGGSQDRVEDEGRGLDGDDTGEGEGGTRLGNGDRPCDIVDRVGEALVARASTGSKDEAVEEDGDVVPNTALDYDLQNPPPPRAPVAPAGPSFMTLKQVVDGLVPQGRPWKARVCATIQRLQTHPDGTRVCFIEDGSAMVAGTLEASAQRVFFGGRTISEILSDADGGALPALLKLGQTAIQGFYGTMEIAGGRDDVAVTSGRDPVAVQQPECPVRIVAARPFGSSTEASNALGRVYGW